MKHGILKYMFFFLGLFLMAILSGCLRGTPSEKPPIHLNPNMDDQEKYEPLEASSFFADGSAMRQRPKGVVARGELKSNIAYETGRDLKGRLIRYNPQRVTRAVLQRGQERYGIYCAPCHGAVGDGLGMVAKRGMPLGLVPPTSFHTDLMRRESEGHLFSTITEGIRNMPSYAHQISVDDRWSIVHYIRTLQRSQHAAAADVPAAVRKGLR